MFGILSFFITFVPFKSHSYKFKIKNDCGQTEIRGTDPYDATIL